MTTLPQPSLSELVMSGILHYHKDTQGHACFPKVRNANDETFELRPGGRYCCLTCGRVWKVAAICARCADKDHHVSDCPN